MILSTTRGHRIITIFLSRSQKVHQEQDFVTLIVYCPNPQFKASILSTVLHACSSAAIAHPWQSDKLGGGRLWDRGLTEQAGPRAPSWTAQVAFLELEYQHSNILLKWLRPTEYKSKHGSSGPAEVKGMLYTSSAVNDYISMRKMKSINTCISNQRNANK